MTILNGGVPILELGDLRPTPIRCLKDHMYLVRLANERLFLHAVHLTYPSMVHERGFVEESMAFLYTTSMPFMVQTSMAISVTCIFLPKRPKRYNKLCDFVRGLHGT